MFYGLFLRGHSIEKIRQDIDVPMEMVRKWMSAPRYEQSFRQNLRRIYNYRKQVLAMFDELVLNDRQRARLQ